MTASIQRSVARVLVAALVAGAASSSVAATRPRSGGICVRGHVGRVATLDPSRASSTIEREVARQLHAGLYGFDRQGEPAPDLVERAEIEAGGAEVRLFLRAARYHDGTPVRAADAVAAIERLRGATVAGALLAGADAEGPLAREAGEREIVLRVAGAPALWPWILADVRAAVIPERGDGSVGAGPFELVERSGDELRLAAAPEHHRGRPLFDQLVYRSFGSPRPLRLGLQRGEIDIIDEAGPSPVEVGTSRGSIGEIAVLSVNGARAPLDRRAVRDALRQALNLDALVDVVLRGRVEKADGILRLRPELDPGPRAEPSRPIAVEDSLTLAHAVGDALESVAERLRVDLHAAGFRSRPRRAAAGEIASGQHDLALVALPVARLPPVLQLAAAADLLGRRPVSLERAMAEVEPRRAGGAALHRAETALLDDAQLLVLFRRDRRLVSGSDLHDLGIAPDGTLRLEDAWRWPVE